MQRDLPDFDTLMKMAINAPEQLDALRKEMAEEIINDAKPEHQQRLKGLQFTINLEIERSPNAYVSCMKISSLMHDSMLRLRSFFDENGVIQDITEQPKTSAKVICFEQSKSKLRA
ncbi:MAG: DUF3135 domain-containing protein [Saccharospirillaceae bacterium]|nr:DUF3135 domain-containing protein [Pseudomonadales bacterium]NRB79235.1 DUF3135 domain-containing protein [Saccharospirillaceae bacterium]